MYDVKLNMPSPWRKESETYLDESGAEITHVEAGLYDEKRKEDDAFVDIYVGDMPDDTTAEDQAFSNYADMVGFSEDDPADFNPIEKLMFNGRKAYGFQALCENDSPMMFLSVEIRHGVLAIICVAAADTDKLADAFSAVEKGLRVSSAQ